MVERFERRKLTGTITLTLSNKEKWSKDKAELCNEIVGIIARYADEGYILTLRQLYYQLVAAGSIRNDDVVYKKMSGILDDLRSSGVVDWDAIEDRGRVPYLPYWVKNIEDAMRDTIQQYRLNRQEGQETHIEVWTEKDAISGILRRITERYHVQLVVNKGYSSSSAMHRAYSRFARVLNHDRKVKILYFGDHDPSGLDMLRDIKMRILFFIVKGMQVTSPEEDEDDFFFKYADENVDHEELVDDGYLSQADLEAWYSIYGLTSEIKADEISEKYWDAVKMHYWSTRFEVVPIGLTIDQVRAYNPPPNPAKITDPRAAWYIKQHGPTSWEVDALPPNIMAALVSTYIEQYLEIDKYNEVLIQEKEDIKKLKAFVASNK